MLQMFEEAIISLRGKKRRTPATTESNGEGNHERQEAAGEQGFRVSKGGRRRLLREGGKLWDQEKKGAAEKAG